MDLDTSIDKLKDYFKWDSALNNTSAFPFWIKDRNFRFKRFNQAMIDKLYVGAKPEDLLDKTDWEYAASLGCDEKIVEDMKNCCQFSDALVLNGDLPSAVFLEHFETIWGESMWLQTAKSKIPPNSTKNTCVGIYGQAIIFPQAEAIIKSSNLHIKKLSDTCYLWEK